MRYLYLIVVFLFVSCNNDVENLSYLSPYTIEDVEMPDGLTAEVGALDFMPDGKLVASFMRGEIMIYNPESKEWKLFARGLHEPLGILVEDSTSVLVMQLPELTRVKDTDGDGTADYFETVYDGYGLTGNYHEFTYGPVRDSKGNLYIALNASSSGGGISKIVRGKLNMDGKSKRGGMFSVVPYRGWVIQLTKQGQVIPYASGFRSPNGLLIDSKDRLYVTDNQGDWVASSPLYYVEKGGFYGQPASLIWTEGWNQGNPFELSVDVLDSLRKKPMIIFPHNVIANSPTQPVLIKNNDYLKDFEGQFIVGEMNQERLVRVIPEEVNGIIQGAVTPFIDGEGLRKGNNRLAFGPDGSLWVGQSDHGWLGDRGIQKISFSKRRMFDVKDVSLLSKGFKLTFTEKIRNANLDSLVQVKRYRYHYHEKYGSEQIDLHKVKVQDVLIKGNEVFLDFESMQKGFVYEIQLDSLFSKNKRDSLHNKIITYTVNELR